MCCLYSNQNHILLGNNGAESGRKSGAKAIGGKNPREKTELPSTREEIKNGGNYLIAGVSKTS